MSKQSDLVSVSQGSGGDPLYIDTTNDRVGVGTTSPVDTFHAVGSDGATSRTTYQGATEFIFENNGDFSIDLSTGNANQAFINWHDTDAVQQGWLSYNHNGDYMRFGTGGSERVRIDAGDITITDGSRYKFFGSNANNVEIGTYSSSNTSRDVHIKVESNGNVGIGASARLDVVGGGGAYFWNSGNFDRRILQLGHTDSNQRVLVQFFSNGTSTSVGSIDTSSTATFYNTSSDYRLKENVTPLANAADRLAQIPVHRFNFIADPDTVVDGFLAHEVQAFVPEAITGEKDAVETVDVTDEDGNVTGTETRPVYQSIDQSKLVPLVTAALQEALQKIDALEARVAALEAV